MSIRKPNQFEDHPEPFVTQTFRAVCTHVTDGDTVDLLVDLGFYAYQYITVRLAGVDAPEIYRPEDDAELEAGRAAKAWVEKRVLGQPVRVRTDKDTETFGRFVAWIEYYSPALDAWVSLNDALVEAGHAEWSDG